MVCVDRRDLQLPSNIWSQKYIVILLYEFPSLVIAAAKAFSYKGLSILKLGVTLPAYNQRVWHNRKKQREDICVSGAISNYCLYIVVKTFKVFSFAAHEFVKSSVLLSLFCSRQISGSSLSLVCQTLQRYQNYADSKPTIRSSTEILLSVSSQIFFIVLYKRGDPKILSPRCTIELHT